MLVSPALAREVGVIPIVNSRAYSYYQGAALLVFLGRNNGPYRQHINSCDSVGGTAFRPILVTHRGLGNVPLASVEPAMFLEAVSQVIHVLEVCNNVPKGAVAAQTMIQFHNTPLYSKVG